MSDTSGCGLTWPGVCNIYTKDHYCYEPWGHVGVHRCQCGVSDQRERTPGDSRGTEPPIYEGPDGSQYLIPTLAERGTDDRTFNVTKTDPQSPSVQVNAPQGEDKIRDNRGTNETPHTPSPSPSPEDVRGLIREGRDTADRMDAAEERNPYPGQVGHANMRRRLTDALERAGREREIDRLNQNATIRGLVQAATDVISERKAAEARVQELERERDQISVDQQIAQGERCARIHADAIAYKARAERAEAALRRYGSHDSDCPPIILPTDRCICGLAKLLDNLATGEAPGEPPSTIA